MALGSLPPNPSGTLAWHDGYTVTAGKIRSFKAYLTRNNLALISADAKEVVRIRYGGSDRQKTTKTGAHFSMIADPPGTGRSFGLSDSTTLCGLSHKGGFPRQ